jgi:organic radical activating enzyme
MQVSRIVITGGEPMLQQSRFSLIQEATGCKLDIETNGTRMPTDDAIAAVDLFCVSPKLAHAGDPEAQRLKPEVLKKFAELSKQGKALFKFVAKDVSDFREIKEFIAAGEIPKDAVWIMPEGADFASQIITTKQIAEAVIAEGWHLSPRLHVLIWSSERGH